MSGTQPQTGKSLNLQEAHLLDEYPKLPHFPPALHNKLIALCGPRWIDLLFHLPTRMLDRSATPTVAAAPAGELATIIATVVKRGPFPPRHIKRPLSIELTDGTAPLRAIFFNPSGWLERAFPEGETVILSGKIESDAKGKKIIHPDVWSAGKGVEKIARVWPLYPLTAGLGQGWLSRSINHALEVAQHNPLPEWLPAAFREKHNLPTFTEALSQVHNPTTEADIAPNHPARARLALDELYATQLALQHARATTRSQTGIAHGKHHALQDKLLTNLPFPLTEDQQTALKEISDDLSAPRPMLRLLQGDVGSGKTLVALFSLLKVIENGHQGVLMAPTEILAQQLFANAKRYLEPLGITVALLTGSLTPAAKKRLKQHVKEGFVNLLVGTHALTEDSVTFHKLGLAVIDEQHRFGVRQRMALSTNQSLPPDMLIMTATPIPRTLALTAYGDMDTSLLRHKPPGRTPIQTTVLSNERLPEIADRLVTLMASGQQAYWVCPLVEESELSDLTAATKRFEWLNRVLPPPKKHPYIALLHGKLKPKEKEDIMAAFKAGHTRLLVSTTVIEVGVDVPNATAIVIEHAERFGLSQLHQLRGRVGRGTLASHCILVYAPPLTSFAKQRLQALRDSEDGFYLAEKDLELRGPGEVLGSRQSGEVATLLADLHHHRDLIPLAKELAEHAISRPLNAAQRNALALLLTTFNKQTAADWLKGG
jgi:ATP-dependent DNA helicase RecG